MLYKIIATISALARQFLLPNPFERFFSDSFHAALFNLLIGVVMLHIFAYVITGAIYDKASRTPIVGSLLYMINYALATGVVMAASLVTAKIWVAILIAILSVIAIALVEMKIKRKVFDSDYAI